MAIAHYQTKSFFRKVNKILLKRYFIEQGVLIDFDFEQLPVKIYIDSLFEAWLVLPEDIRASMEMVFQEINGLASESGNDVLINEAKNKHEDLVSLFQQAEIEGFYDKAFWVYLEKSQYWERAKTFNYVENIRNSYWKKRASLGHLPVKTDQQSLSILESEIAGFFFSEQGRGKSCQLDYYERMQDDVKIDYFFIYPEDYTRADLEWHNGQMERRTIRPAFEVIFVYNQERGELDLYYPGATQKQKNFLQKLFCRVILGIELPEELKEQSYDIKPLLNPEFEFSFNAQQTGVEEMFVSKMFIQINRSKREKLALEADTKTNRLAVYDLLKKIQEAFPDLVEINQVTIKAIFSDQKSREFSVSSKDSCTLNLNDKDNRLKQILIESKVQLTPS